MKLTAVISCVVAILGLFLGSCASNEIVNTFASSLYISECIEDALIVDYEKFDMSISDGTAKCLVRKMRSAYGYDGVTVKVEKSQHHVKVIIEHYYSDDSDDTACYRDISFSLEDLPEEDFLFEVFSRSFYDIENNHFTMEFRNPHIRETIHINDPKNSHLVFWFSRHPDMNK